MVCVANDSCESTLVLSPTAIGYTVFRCEMPQLLSDCFGSLWRQLAELSLEAIRDLPYCSSPVSARCGEIFLQQQFQQQAVHPMLTSRELVQRALTGDPVPRPATGPLAVHYCARLAGYSLRRYTTDLDAMVASIVRYYEIFRPDAIWLSADTWVNAQAMGARVGFADDDQPMGGVGAPLIQQPQDIDAIPPPDPESQGRWPMMLAALERLVQQLGTDVFVVACFDQYPFSLACALMGIDQLMFKLIDDRPMVEALMHRCADYTAAYAAALAEAGADMLSGGDSPAGLVGPHLYREVVLPSEQQLIRRVRAATSIPVSLHICGDASSLLADMARTGANVLELDHQVDIETAVAAVGPEIALWGNLDPVAVLAQAAPSDVQAATSSLLRAIQRRGHRRFVLSSGCTLAVETPAENLHAMLETARQWHNWFA